MLYFCLSLLLLLLLLLWRHCGATVFLLWNPGFFDRSFSSLPSKEFCKILPATLGVSLYRAIMRHATASNATEGVSQVDFMNSVKAVIR